MRKVRYLAKHYNANERNNFSLWWKEQIEHYGVKVNYYTNGYTLTSQDFMYGEDPTSTFLSAGEVIMVTNITNDSILLSKFGVMADCDMTAMIHVSSYYETFGQGTEPKSGDLIEMIEYGGFGDRPDGRGAPIYEITERDDEYLPQTNALMGHYVWYIKCKRFEYSYEPGMHAEPANTQINDTTAFGRLSGGANPEELTPSVNNSNVDIEGAKLFDYSTNKLSSPYGNY